VALRALCQVLASAGEGQRETSLLAPSPSQPVDWHQVATVAAELLVAPPLWRAVQPGLEQIPTDVVEELRGRYLANTIRNVRFRHSLAEAVGALNEVGVVPVLLKGATGLTCETDGKVGDRWMADLDLLIAPSELTAATAALKGLGYRADASQPWVTYELPFCRSRTPGPIDVHFELGVAPLPGLVPGPEARDQSVDVSVGGHRARVLSPTHQALHCVAHSSVQELDHAVGGLPLRQLLTLSDTVTRHGPTIDWSLIRERMEAHGLARKLTDYLWLANRFAGMELPPLSGRWRTSARIHERRVLVSFALGWPTDVNRNLRLAFGRMYLDALYDHGNRPLKLAGARVRHAARVVRRDGRSVLDHTLGHTN
jgi:hypothetical protein